MCSPNGLLDTCGSQRAPSAILKNWNGNVIKHVFFFSFRGGSCRWKERKVVQTQVALRNPNKKLLAFGNPTSVFSIRQETRKYRRRQQEPLLWLIMLFFSLPIMFPHLYFSLWRKPLRRKRRRATWSSSKKNLSSKFQHVSLLNSLIVDGCGNKQLPGVALQFWKYRTCNNLNIDGT